MVDQQVPTIECQTVLVCDDVRRELSGKDIIIGVYPGDIIVSSFPMNLVLSFWLQIKPSGFGKANADFQILSPFNSQLSSFGVFFELGNSDVSSIITPQIPVQVQQAGDLTLQMKQAADDWRTIKRVGIRQMPRVSIPPGLQPAKEAAKSR